jgi:HSP20 family protein
MTMLTRWEPFTAVSPVFGDRMSQWFNEFLRQPFWNLDGNTGLSRFVPAADIREDAEGLTIYLEAPGLTEQDFEITLENNILTVRGERKLEQDEKMENFHRVERFYGAFSRSFTLPNTVDPESVNASYVNGVLEVHLAKRAEARPRQIQVRPGQKVLQGKRAAA